MLGIAVSPNASQQFVGAHTRHTAPGRGDTATFDERFQVCAMNEDPCLGAAHARLLIRSLLGALCDQVERIEVLDAVAKIEEESSFTRQVGYDTVTARFLGREGARGASQRP